MRCPVSWPLAARAQVLFEQNTFVSDVLVNDPKAFAVHGHDVAGAHLAQRLEPAQAFGAGERLGIGACGNVTDGGGVGRREIAPQSRNARLFGQGSDAVFKLEALRLRP